MIKQTQSLLEDLKMKGIMATLSQRLQEAQEQELGYEDFLNLIFEDEKLRRENDKITRLLKKAALQQKASLEAFQTKPHRGVDKKMLNDLALMRFVRNGQNIIISGPTGVGKSYLACAIGNNVCRNGFTAQFYRLNTLIEKFRLERAKGSYLHFIKRLVSVSVLIIDDFGIKPLEPHQYQDLYDVVDERGIDGSTIMTTQLPVANWSEVIEDPVICEAITDRLMSGCIKIRMSGESFRQKNKGEIDKV